MMTKPCICRGGALAVLFLMAAAPWSRAADSSAPTAAKTKPSAANAATASETKDPAADSAPRPKKTPQLSPEMTERRDRVRRVLAALRRQPFNTQQNTAGEILDFCRAFGCDTELTDNATSGQKVNGITCLCWNLPCAGYEMLTVSEGHLAPRVGYGYQSQPSDLAAVLALSRAPTDYPARAGKTVRTIADLIEYEKRTCRAGTDMSLKLVALSKFVREPSWKDSLGGEWTLKRVLAEELYRPLGSHPHAATNRLLGLACVLDRFKADKAPQDGDMTRAAQYVNDSMAYAYSSQNADGSWGRPTRRDYATAMSYTAHMLRWLIHALPGSQLEDPRIVRGIDFIQGSFAAPHYQAHLPSMSPRDISAAMHAAYVLSVYDQRVFAPADPPPAAEPSPNGKSEAKSAARPAPRS
jgi:hypothetical protein